MAESKKQILERQIQAAMRVLECHREVFRRLAECEAAESGRSRKKKKTTSFQGGDGIDRGE